MSKVKFAVWLMLFWVLTTVIMEDVVHSWTGIDWTMVLLGAPFSFVLAFICMTIAERRNDL